MQRNTILLDTVGQADFSDGNLLDYMEIQACPVTCSHSHLSIVTLPTETHSLAKQHHSTTPKMKTSTKLNFQIPS